MLSSLKKCLLRFSTNEREYLGNVSNIPKCNESPRPDLETRQFAYEPIIGNVGNKVEVLLLFSVVDLLMFVSKGTVSLTRCMECSCLL